MKKPLFSVGIVSYNQKEYIFDCIGSILRQNYPAIELVIADDHSYDFDREKIEAYIRKHRRPNLVRYVIFTNEENVGIVKNCNRCIREMRGEYIKTIAADDTFLGKDVLLKMHRLFEADGQARILCARARAIMNDGTPTQDLYPSDYDFHRIAGMSASEMYTYMITRPWCPVFAPCVFMRRDFFEQMGGYDEQYVYTEDWPLWIRITRAGCRLTFTDEIVIQYRYGGISNQGRSEFKINHLRARHYQECAQILKNELPYLRKHGSKGQILRCWYSANAIEMRRELEFFWTDASFRHKLSFRLRMLPVHFYIKLMSAVTYHRRFGIKKECAFLVAAGLALQYGLPVFPWDHTGKLLAGIILLLAASLTVKVIANLGLSLLSLRAAYKTRVRGGVV